VFVNFSETLNTLCDMLGSDTARVCGGQSGNEREQNVQRFQRNECGVIVCNTAAGGVGVSLHDEHGGHPRMALLSPTFNEKEYVQVLGRIHRAGSKSPALQRVLIASGTIEEKIIAKLEEKRKDMAALHEQLKTES
jgi:SNF2 family DNA or RNA helicase